MPILPMAPQEPDALVCVLRAPQYVVSASVGFVPRHMRTAHITLDTGAGVNIIRQNLLPADWQRYRMRDVSLPALGDANGHRLSLLGAVRLRIRFGNFVYHTVFYVANRLAVPAILGTVFLNRYVVAIRCMEQRIQFHQGPVVPILSEGNGVQPTPSPNEVDEQFRRLDADSERAEPIQTRKPIGLPTGIPIRMVKVTKLKPMSHTKVRVTARRGGLLMLQSREQLVIKRGVHTPNGVAEVKPDQPFEILLANFTTKEVVLNRGQIVAHGTRTSSALHQLTPQLSKQFVASILAIPEPEPGTNLTGPVTVVDPKTVGVPPADDSLPELDPEIEADKEPPDGEVKGEEEAPDDWRSKIKLGHVDIDLRAKVIAMLEKHQAMWQPGHLGEISATEHRIELLPGTKPVRQLPYRQGLHKRQETEKAINEMMEAGVIEPCNSEWASPVVLAPKADGNWRFCVDYRRLNAATVPDSYPLPRADDCLDSLGEAVIFTTLDCNSGYWQIPLPDEDKDKTTFISHMGTHRYIRMPFGLRNAPATFQRALDIILSGVRWQTCLIYLDDVIVFSKSMEKHIQDVDEVLQLLGDAGVSLKLKKCEFFQPRVNYLGHVVTPGKLSMAADRAQGFRNSTFPLDKGMMMSFLGAANYFRRFVPNFAKIARPLTEMTKKDAPNRVAQPTKEQNEAFETLKNALSNPPILALPRLGCALMLDTDASAYQLGVALMQQAKPDDVKSWEPIGFWSKSLNAAEKNYSATERECLAVVWGMTSLRPYVEGQKVTVRTDHDALQWLLTLDDPSGRLARWRLRLSEFSMEIVYRKGRKHQVPDALSRIPHEGEDDTPIDDEIPGIDEFLLVVTRAQRQRSHQPGPPSLLQQPELLHDANRTARVEPSDDDGPSPTGQPAEETGRTQDAGRSRDTTTGQETPDEDGAIHLACPDHATHFNMEEDDMFIDHTPAQPTGTSPEFEKLPSAITIDEIIEEQRVDNFCQTVLANMGKYSAFYEDEDGVVRRRPRLRHEYAAIVLPPALRPRALHLMHYVPTAGHPGQTKMYANMRRQFYWPHMAADIFTTVRDCVSCARERVKQRTRRGPLHPFPPEGPLEDISVDLVGPFPTTKKGYTTILVICDRFTKLTQVVPLRTTEAYDCAVAFVEHWVYKYGAPNRVVSDNGPQFVAKLFQSVCRLLGMKTTTSAAFHPQTNGQVERYNRSLLAMLRHYVGDHQDDWDRYAGAVTYAYNMSVHRSTGATPFELVLSRPPPPFAIQHSTSRRRQGKSKMQHADYLNRLEDAITKSKANLSASQERYKRDFDKRIKGKLPVITEGDWVFIDPGQRTGPTNKLAPVADGRFRVLSTGRGTLVIKRGQLVERINRSRAELAPPPDDDEQADSTDPTDADFAEKTHGEEWVIKRIKDHEPDEDGKLWFLVEWAGEHDDSWQPRRDLDESTIAHYFARIRKRKDNEQRRERGRIKTAQARQRRAARGRAVTK